jgi:hypothetical protein
MSCDAAAVVKHHLALSVTMHMSLTYTTAVCTSSSAGITTHLFMECSKVATVFNYASNLRTVSGPLNFNVQALTVPLTSSMPVVAALTVLVCAAVTVVQLPP